MPDAPLVVVFGGRAEDDFQRQGAEYYLLACGLAAENLMLQAVHMGLRVHPMVGWNEAEVAGAVGAPEGYRIVLLIAVGYPGDPSRLPEGLRSRELGARSRLPRGENFFRERWGEPWD